MKGIICLPFNAKYGKEKKLFSLLARAFTSGAKAGAGDRREVDAGAAALRQPSDSVGSRDPRPVDTCQRTCTVACRGTREKRDAAAGVAHATKMA